VEKAKLGAGEEVTIALLSGVDHHLMPRPTPSSRDDEVFAVHLKPLIRMTVPAEEHTSLLETKKRVGKIDFDFLIRTDHPAVGEGGLVAADNNGINLRFLFESLKLLQIPLKLFLVLFLRQGREIGINQDESSILPGKAVPASLIKMRETSIIVL